VCEDPEPARIAIHTMARDGRVVGDDSVAIVLDTYGDRRTGYFFRSNAAGSDTYFMNYLLSGGNKQTYCTTASGGLYNTMVNNDLVSVSIHLEDVCQAAQSGLRRQRQPDLVNQQLCQNPILRGLTPSRQPWFNLWRQL
jgi:hypothetical protein